jgi:hypothetical protein
MLKAEWKVYDEGGKEMKELSLDLTGKENLEDLFKFFKTSLANFAFDALEQEQKLGGMKNPIYVVDGVRNGNPFEVNPWGKIEIYDRIAEQPETLKKIIKNIYHDLQKRSPVDTGQYKNKGNIVLLNGALVAKNPAELEIFLAKDLETIDDKSVFTFLNVAPYASKLERMGTIAGRSSGMKWTDSKDTNRKRRMKQSTNGKVRRPNGVYFVTSRSYIRRFAANIDVSFGFMQGGRLNLDDYAFAFIQKNTGKPMRRTFSPLNKIYKGPYVYPYIQFKIRKDAFRGE